MRAFVCHNGSDMKKGSPRTSRANSTARPATRATRNVERDPEAHVRPRKRTVHGWHHFVLPTRANKHHPHILKREIVVGVLVCALVLEVAVLAQGLILFKNQNYLASVLPSVVASLTNNQRTQNDLPALTVSPLLTQAAQEKANDMAAKGYFSHVSPDGTLPWKWFQEVGYNYQFAGENLAVNFNDSSDVVNAWMASPTHRANILKQQYTQVGIGMASGMYEGKSTIFVVQFFATPEAGSAVSAPDTGPPASSDVAAAIPLPASAPTPQTKPAALASTPVATKSASDAVAKIPAPTELMTTNTPAPAAFEVLGAQTQIAQPAQSAATPSFFQTLLASPFTSANDIFVFVAAFMLAILISAVLFRKRLPRMTATIGGLSVAVVVFGFAVLNQHYFAHDVSVDQTTVTTATSAQ